VLLNRSNSLPQGLRVTILLVKIFRHFFPPRVAQLPPAFLRDGF
jgi:hypothetical protein